MSILFQATSVPSPRNQQTTVAANFPCKYIYIKKRFLRELPVCKQTHQNPKSLFDKRGQNYFKNKPQALLGLEGHFSHRRSWLLILEKRKKRFLLFFCIPLLHTEKEAPRKKIKENMNPKRSVKTW